MVLYIPGANSRIPKGPFLNPERSPAGKVRLRSKHEQMAQLLGRAKSVAEALGALGPRI